jgi:ligand-binding sensor domain-containing protein
VNLLTVLLLLQFLIIGNCTLQAQRTGSEGPYTGIVNCLTSNGNFILAGTGKGVFISFTYGKSWLKGMGLPNKPVKALAISKTNLFAGTSGGGIFISSNNGVSWEPVKDTLTNTDLLSLMINGTNIFAGTVRGVFLSTNKGTNWKKVNNGISEHYSIRSLVCNESNIFAGTDSGVFLSKNNGTNWTQINNGLTTTNVTSLALNDSIIFAGTNKGVFLSKDNGTNWILASNKNVHSLAVSGSNVFAGTDKGVFLSTNYGSNWTKANYGLSDTTINAIAFYGNTIFAGSYDGVFLSNNNGSTWTSAKNISTLTRVNLFLKYKINYINTVQHHSPVGITYPRLEISITILDVIKSPGKLKPGDTLMFFYFWNSENPYVDFQLKDTVFSGFSTWEEKNDISTSFFNPNDSNGSKGKFLIINGILFDLNNFWGYGKSVPWEDFKKKITQDINNIISAK